jgi:hypothetical protein
MCAAVEFRILDGIADFAIPQATEWQRIGNQTNAATISARSHLVFVDGMHIVNQLGLSRKHWLLGCGQ